ncbi:hemerythrin domain-containing protein [Virgibacillus sp. YIM 98842]|uniref:hemerythrin domain-containing protein n=1 Tax=Virgibacillus sp. YIM 98842 TaxID=2663533 RepID=UPI0013DD5D95|nr:hemerythrin domain-containing protein [Virgibacillus sp. YIM 98842]
MAATGPSLRKRDSHSAIHHGAYVEARDLTEVTDKLFYDGREEDCFKAAEALIEYWETRVIAHADTEDDGFYKELLEKKPELEKDLHMLSRDHDLFRIIIGNIKEQIEGKNKVTKEILNQFHALLVIKEIHNHGEETRLFNEQD